jgi:hypothetical protein
MNDTISKTNNDDDMRDDDIITVPLCALALIRQVYGQMSQRRKEKRESCGFATQEDS